MTEKQESILTYALDMDSDFRKVEDGLYETDIYWDRYKISDEQLKEISESDTPWDTFYALLSGMEDDFRAINFPEMYNNLRLRRMSPGREQELDSGEAIGWLYEHVSCRFPENSFLDQRVRVNLILATPEEANRDFGDYQVFNSFGDGKGELPTDCALMWLARQYSLGKELSSAVTITAGCPSDEDERPVFADSFIESMVSELENLSHCMGALTILLDMSLEDFLKLREMELGHSDGTLVVSPGAFCGLFAPWVGGGSSLDIQLPDLLKIPSGMIWSTWIDGSAPHGYDPGDVYGLCGSAWKDGYRLEDVPRDRLSPAS